MTRNWAYVFCTFALAAGAGCRRGDQAEPAAGPPQPEHVIYFAGVGTDLSVGGDHLAIAAKNGGVSIFEVSTSGRPLPVTSVPAILPHKVLVKGGVVLAFDEEQGLGAVDLRDTGSLELRQALSTVELYGYVDDALWQGDSLILASDAIGLSAYDVAAGAALSPGQRRFPAPPQHGAHSLAMTSNRVVAASYEGNLSVYDWQAPEPALTGWLPTEHKVAALACRFATCYASGLGDGLFIYDVSDGESPRLAAELPLAKAVGKVFVDWAGILIAALSPRDNGFYAFPLDGTTVPTAPARWFPTTSPVRGFATAGSHVYVLLSAGELWVYPREVLR